MSRVAGIYFDNNATTRVAREAADAMLPFLREHYGNPSSPHAFARAPALGVSKARDQVASLLGVNADHLVFTSGGTESNAMAIIGALPCMSPRNEVILSAVEHASVWAWRERLPELGYTVHIVPVDRSGALDMDAFRACLSERTALVCVMLANNETGVLYPVKKITEMAHAAGALVHTDAVQAAGKISLNLAALGVDYAAVCGHKFHAVKGVGALYLREPKQFRPLLLGGEQEFGRRPGTEPVASIVAMGAAAQVAREWLSGDGPSAMVSRRDDFESWLLETVPGVSISGHSLPRLPNTTHALIAGVETEPLLALLDMKGVAVSSGSACASGAHEPSHVLMAMGLPVRDAAVLRISASRYTTDKDFQRLREALASSVAQLAAVSPGTQ